VAKPLFYDRVKETTATTGTGTLTLAGAATGFRAFSTVGNGNSCCFCITDSAGNWEVAVGTYTSAGTTLSRQEVLSSSNAGAAVNFAAGTKDVFLVDPAVSAGPQVVRPGGRLTMTTATSVTTTDVTGASAQTLYYTPHRDDRLELWDGYTWRPTTFSEVSLASSSIRASRGGGMTGDITNGSPIITNFTTTGFQPGDPVVGSNIPTTAVIKSVDSGTQVTLTENATATATGASLTVYYANYDVFGYLSSGVLALETTRWATNTTRNTAVVYADGRLTRTGAKDRLYLGSVRLASYENLEDSVAKRFVWNAYSRVERPMQAIESAASWTYSTAAWRAVNANNAIRLQMMRGLDEDAAYAAYAFTAFGSGWAFGIGLDSTTAVALIGSGASSGAVQITGTTPYAGLPGLGFHYLQALEYCTAGTTTATGVSAPYQTGIVGRVLA
jgi:hypothetical protein